MFRLGLQIKTQTVLRTGPADKFGILIDFVTLEKKLQKIAFAKSITLGQRKDVKIPGEIRLVIHATIISRNFCALQKARLLSLQYELILLNNFRPKRLWLGNISRRSLLSKL